MTRSVGHVCQSCTEEILVGQQVVRLTYGTAWLTAHPRARVDRKSGDTDDWFHAACIENAAFRYGQREATGDA